VLNAYSEGTTPAATLEDALASFEAFGARDELPRLFVETAHMRLAKSLEDSALSAIMEVTDHSCSLRKDSPCHGFGGPAHKHGTCRGNIRIRGFYQIHQSNCANPLRYQSSCTTLQLTTVVTQTCSGRAGWSRARPSMKAGTAASEVLKTYRSTFHPWDNAAPVSARQTRW
jgi:hypothetical protein